MAERELISNVRERFYREDGKLIAGIGDDCALFGNQENNPWMISTDMLVENVHFNRSWHPPYRLGRKVVAVNISDVAAMGGVPKFILLSICLPARVHETWLEKLIDGIYDICREYDCIVIGGDTVSGEELALSVTVVGTAGLVAPVKRSGAEVGDEIYVSGNLGNAALGLELFRSGDKSPAGQNVFHLAHLDPTPQVNLGRKLAEHSIATAMQDLSDGIATDLAHICFESKVGALLNESLLPMEPGFAECCNRLGLDPTKLQLNGGEDYHLVFSAPVAKRHAIKKLQAEGFTLYKVGEITAGQGVALLKKNSEVEDISYQGYEHS